MTHASNAIARKISWEECRIVRYEGNNGIVLFHKKPNRFEDVLFYIDGADVGVTKDDLSDVPLERALPIFKVMLQIHNVAHEKAYELGYKTAQNDIKRALGI